MAEDGATKKPRVLLVDSDRKHLHWLARVIRTVVSEAETRQTPDLKDADEFDLLAINYDGLSPDERKALITQFSSGSTKVPLLLISDGKSHDDFVPLFAGHTITNLLAKNESVDAEDLIVTLQKILRRDVFGIEKYFVWGVEMVTTSVTKSSEKERVIAWAGDYASKLDVPPRLVSQFCTVVDEFLTNAVYNAPLDKDGKYRFAHVSRAEEVALEPDEAVVIRLCCDGRRLGVSATDPFGSLTKERILDYLAKCFRKSDDQVDQKDGGAGLGLYLLFDALSHFVVNMSRGRRTEMIGLIDVRGSYRDFATKAKSFNIFSV